MKSGRKRIEGSYVAFLGWYCWNLPAWNECAEQCMLLFPSKSLTDTGNRLAIPTTWSKMHWNSSKQALGTEPFDSRSRIPRYAYTMRSSNATAVGDAVSVLLSDTICYAESILKWLRLVRNVVLRQKQSKKRSNTDRKFVLLGGIRR